MQSAMYLEFAHFGLVLKLHKIRGGDMAAAVIARRGWRAVNNQFRRDINWRARRLLSGMDQSEGGEIKEMQDVEFSAFESEMKSLQRDFEKMRNDLKVDFEKIESEFKMDREFRHKIDNASYSDQLNRSNEIRRLRDEFEKKLDEIIDHNNKLIEADLTYKRKLQTRNIWFSNIMLLL